MMINTILLLFLLVGFLAVIIYLLLQSDRFFKRKNVLLLSCIFVTGLAIFLQNGPQKVRSDIVRIFNNSRPKSAEEIYVVLFGGPVDRCVRVVNLKDQVIPRVDCCIWMELNMCPVEVRRIIQLKNYSAQLYTRQDSLSYLANYPNRPEWWAPQNLGHNITVLQKIMSERNQQSIFLNSDSTRAFICDMAL